MSDARSIRAYWAAVDRRDWVAFAALLREDVVYRIPQSDERITGRDSYLRFNVEYPGEWSIHVERVMCDESEGVSWITFDVDSALQTAVTFFRFDTDGLIAEIDDFWPEAYDAPPRPAGLMDA